MSKGENLEQKDIPILSESELEDVSISLLSQTEFGRNIRLGQIAQEKNSTPDKF